MVKVNTTNLLTVFTRLNLMFGVVRQFFEYVPSLLNHLFSKQFVRFIWFLHKKLLTRKFGLYSNNLIKGYMRGTVSNLSTGLTTYSAGKSGVSLLHYVGFYSKPIHTFNFSFHKQTYNTFIFFIIYTLLDSYVTNTTNFHLYYSFIFLKPNMYLLSTLNNYYLKVHSH